MAARTTASRGVGTVGSLRLLLGAGAVAALAIAGSWLGASRAGQDSAEIQVVTAPSVGPVSTPTPGAAASPTATATPPPGPTPTATPSTAPPVVDARPLRVHVPSIGVDAEMIDLGTNADGTLEVPVDFAQVGWYTGRAVPGEPGPAILAGHVDSFTGPAVFFDLADLQQGAIVEVDRTDGLTASYRVVEVFEVDKDAFPTDLVYGPTEGPELRLVTCGGNFDSAVRSYESNVIVMAEHIENRPTGPPTAP